MFIVIIIGGRWDNTSLEDRKSTLCNKNDIGDELHYLFVCSHYKSDRKRFFKFHIFTKTI